MAAAETSSRLAQVAAEWIARRDRGLTPAEEDAFRAWLAADPRHPAELERQAHAWQSLEALRGDPTLEAMADAVAQCLFTHSAIWPGGDSAGRLVCIVCRDNGGALVVVAGVKDVRHSIPDPVGWLGCSQFINYQYLGVKDRS